MLITGVVPVEAHKRYYGEFVQRLFLLFYPVQRFFIYNYIYFPVNRTSVLLPAIFIFIYFDLFRILFFFSRSTVAVIYFIFEVLLVSTISLVDAYLTSFFSLVGYQYRSCGFYLCYSLRRDCYCCG